MIKLVGAVLIIGVTALFGFSGVQNLNAHVKSIRSFIHALEIMKAEICVNMTPMRQLMLILSRCGEKPADRFFKDVSDNMDMIGKRSFGTIWKNSITNASYLKLDREEKAILAQLGLSLGKYDVNSQVRLIERAIGRLLLQAESAERDRETNSKLHAFMGVAAGLFVVVILL